MMNEIHKGIDVSKWNGVVDWEAVKDDGVEFAIIRLGYGDDFDIQDDPQAVRNMEECERLKIPYGLYLFSDALDSSNAVSEAAHALRIAEGRNVTLGVWYDMENDDYKLRHGFDVYKNGTLITEFCRIFCEKMRDAGYQTGIYASLSLFTSTLDNQELAEFDKWVAHWDAAEAGMDCLLWQYSCNGRSYGSKNNSTDLNYYYGSF